MDERTPAGVLPLLVAFFEYVAKQDFAGLAGDSRFSGATEGWLRQCIGEYQESACVGVPTMPPISALSHPLEVVALDASACGREGWAIDVDFYFDFVRGDLALTCTAVRDDDGNWRLEIDEIHVP